MAAGAQYCERTNYSAQEITNAVQNSSLRDDLKATSCSLGGLGRFESGGNKGVYNGSCCTGIFQLNNANIQKYAGTDRAGYGCESLQQQVNAWANLTNYGYNSSAVRQLASMSTFDGQQVDASLIAACIQLGTGNCQKMVDSGRVLGLLGHQRHDHLRHGEERAEPGRSELPERTGDVRFRRPR